MHYLSPSTDIHIEGPAWSAITGIAAIHQRQLAHLRLARGSIDNSKSSPYHRNFVQSQNRVEANSGPVCMLLRTTKTVIPIQISKSMKGTLQHQIREKSVQAARELVQEKQCSQSRQQERRPIKCQLTSINPGLETQPINPSSHLTMGFHLDLFKLARSKRPRSQERGVPHLIRRRVFREIDGLTVP